MKSARLAAILLLLLATAVTLNSLYIFSVIDKISEKIDEIETSASAKADIEKIYRDFQKHKKIISLTVSHDDLTNIENSFSELVGAYEAGAFSEIMIIKSRLKDSLEDLGRLSGFNFDSIF